MKSKTLALFTLLTFALFGLVPDAWANENVVVVGPVKTQTDGSKAVTVRIVDGNGADVSFSGSAGLTDTQLRASAVAVTVAGAATAANQAAGNTSAATTATNTGNIPAKGAAAPSGSTPVIQATATTVKSTALEASHVLKASAGSLVSVLGFNSKATAQYILVMDSATVPSNGAVTLLCPPIYVPGTSNFSLNFTTPLAAANGIAVSNSSTGSFTLTAGSADCIFTAQVQ